MILERIVLIISCFCTSSRSLYYIDYLLFVRDRFVICTHALGLLLQSPWSTSIWRFDASAVSSEIPGSLRCDVVGIERWCIQRVEG